MKTIRFILISCLMLLAAVNVQANDYLEQKDHYTVYATGAGVIHFKIPIYSRGGWDYLVSTDGNGNSAFYYKLNGTEYEIFYIGGEKDSNGPSADDDISYGRGYVTVKPNKGTVEVTNIYNGTRVVVPNDDISHGYDVTKKKETDNDKDYVTWLELDWYMPAALDGLSVTIGAHIKLSRRASSEIRYTKDWEFGVYTGASAMMEPQLYDPFFYATKEDNLSGYGCAAVPYVLYYEPKYYTTTLTGNTQYPTTKRTDNIFVQTTDTLQPGFKASFDVYRRKKPTEDIVRQTTNVVTIPAYHRIYDFAVSEEKDEFNTYTGNNVLMWNVKNPHVVDLVEGDFFEIQRALKSDFSDAQTIEVIPMERGVDKANYTYVDNNRASWTGNNTNVQYTETIRHDYETRISDYVMTDADGNPMCKMSFNAKALAAYLPSVPVYYRVRRASASMWGWKGHEFARDTVCMKHNFLAPLSYIQPQYVLNAETREVDLRVRLENADVAAISIPDDNIELYDFYVKEHYPKEDILHVHVKFQRPLWGWAHITIRDSSGETIIAQYNDLKQDTVLEVPANSMLYAASGAEERTYSSRNVRVDRDMTVSYYHTYVYGYMQMQKVEIVGEACSDMATVLTGTEQQRLNEIAPQLRREIGADMARFMNDNIGKCMWDKSARLVLIKTMDGVKQELIIPQDSIRRLANGNWEAHYVDLANHACTNYSYAVRIDQSSADLHVSDSVFLQPQALTGPSLYFEEGASIKTAKASYNDARGDLKRGIMLEWTATTAAVDQYVILRGKHDEEPPHDTVYVGVDNTFFDTSVPHGLFYDYDIHAIYDCNGRHSDNYRRVTGRRSKYGEISGRILMPDNSGMAGVTVSMTKQGEYSTYTRITGADGTFKFDSLLYGDYDSDGADFTIVPSSQYGTFSFNNTSAGSATVHLSEENCIARDIVFTNTSTTRLSGRALYKGSTIPVAGAMFLLSGDTIRRNGALLKTGIDGNFELTLTKGQPYQLQIIKPGHTFEGDGILRVEEGKDTFALDKPLDGVRFYDETKVRLVGRVAGGNDQRNLPAAFSLGKNNLGDDLQLVLELEGDNVAHLVSDPNDPTLDSVQQTFDHLVYTTDPMSAVPSRKVGSTYMCMEKKRVIIRPDAATGEFAVDLYPVKYKVTQASAKGYATLFAAGQGNEVFDLTNAPLASYNPKRGTDSVHYNAVYDRIYHTPVKIHMQQLLYGLAQPGYGEKAMKVSSFNHRSDEEVALYIEGADNSVTYTMGYPVFCNNRKYQFEAQAYEDYYYNNDSESGALDRVPQRGGSVTIHNGMEGTTKHYTYPLDSVGKNRNIYLTVDQLETEFTGTNALHTVSAALEVEGNTVETEVFRGFISGDRVMENELQSTDADITILDIVRDPGGDGSSAWVESGTTYTYSYSQSFDANVGLELSPTWGSSLSTAIGVVSAPQGAGDYVGQSTSTSKEFSFTIPLTHEWAWNDKYTYSFTTNDKISTSSSKNKQGIGSNADVFLGTTTSVLTGKAKSVSVINDTMYHQHLPAIQAGTMRVLAQGADTAGKPYYLVVGEKVVLGSRISNTFVYSQYHIYNTILPRLFLERDNLLEYFADEAAAQTAANMRGEEVYWAIDSLTALQLNDTLYRNSYKMIVPVDVSSSYTNRVQSLDNIIRKWITVLYKNEEEKIKAKYMGTTVGTYSVSAGNTYNHSETYSSTVNYSQLPQFMAFASQTVEGFSNMATDVTKNLKGLGDMLSDNMDLFASNMMKVFEAFDNGENEDGNTLVDIASKNAGASFKWKFKPILDLDIDAKEGSDLSHKKSTGFTIVPDNQGEITVAVYRAPLDSVWNSLASTSIDHLNTHVPTTRKYGSYVFFTQAGSTYCPYEDEDETKFYNPGTPLNNSTMLIAKPAMSINTYEQTNVLPDQRAKFTIELRNAGEVQYGWAGSGMPFTLTLANESNPHGAKLYVNGAPLSQGIELFMEPGQSFKQTLEVERGEVDDYENMRLLFKVSDCPKNNAFLDFSVHFIPLSCDVQIDMPRQNWVMNTLSQRDSAGYYIPVEISGFDTHHKNFDHIEFQYKQSKQSEEKWVTALSFYAEDSLYEKATGNKAMIENGRIVPFRFYGERDPMEQEYDLRAVSFCRYGSGYVHKASPVISGVKDTRVPVLFGDPEPVNSILGVGDHLKLRFSEPIAGNYLDEDNNFSLKGVTNKTGITAGTSLHFDGSESSYATTKVDRDLSNKSVSIDLLVKPSENNQDAVFFSHGAGKNVTSFGITADRRLYLTCPQSTFYSRPLEAMLDFTRVTMVYDNEQNTIRFFAGTKEMTDASQQRTSSETLFYNAPLVFGKGFNGNMLEARVWSKALTAEEIAATHLRRLSGYERGLTAYYPMNEGRHETCTDKANGATLYLHNTTWTLQKGISMALHNDSLELAGNLMSRSDVYDETFMLWFKTASKNAPIFRASTGWLGMEDGLLTLRCDTNAVVLFANASDNEWHHFALAINRANNTASFFLDGKLMESVPATDVKGLRGAMYLGGKDFVGNIDELTIYEQALPRNLIEERYNMAPAGDEMGLIAYLPFSKQILNPNGILELVFSPNDQRVFKGPDGNVIDKVVSLVLTQDAADMADKTNFAPIRDHGLLNKLKFGWAFNTDELLINLTMQDYEINKQTVYVTVRDVEDLHGNPMASPVTWSAFVDRNTLKWEKRDIYYSIDFDNQDDLSPYTLTIRNISGRTHQYMIDNLPDWLSARTAGGTLTALEEKPIELRLTREMAPGEYTETIYLTDENGLAEPLNIHLSVVANPPYEELDENKYPYNMSLCAKVLVNTSTLLGLADEQDIVYAFCNQQMVGMAHVRFNDRSNEAELFLTVNGDETMVRKPVSFRLWRAATGKTYSLYCPKQIVFAHGFVYGCGDETPLYLTTTGTEMMSISLKAGWNWISTNLDFTDSNGEIAQCVSAAEPWTVGDIIKNPATRQFVNFDTTANAFVGTLKNLAYPYMYMVYTATGNTMRIAGDQLPPEAMHITLRGDGLWNALPCLFSQTISLSEAMADYFDKAAIGDIIKSKKHFSYFSADKRWVGDLTALTPGEGYLLRRLGAGAVDIHFYDRPASDTPKRSELPYRLEADYGFCNPNAATNMTMIAKVQSDKEQSSKQIHVYVGNELAAVAEPIIVDNEAFYFLTLQSDKLGESLRFKTEDGTLLIPSLSEEGSCEVLPYVGDSHVGSIEAPVMLRMDKNRPYKILEDNHVVIIRNNEKYDATGKKL